MQPTPFYDDDYLYFELKSPKLCALDLYNEPATYSIADFSPGIYSLPIDSIPRATRDIITNRPGEVFSVDNAQCFLIDADYVRSFRETVVFEEACYPNYSYFKELRRQLGIDFGFANLYSDAVYFVDPSKLFRLDPTRDLKTQRPALIEDPYEKVARRLGDFLCEVCLNEAFPGMEDYRGSYRALALEAKQKGWRIVLPLPNRKTRSFDAFQVVGPNCAKALGLMVI